MTNTTHCQVATGRQLLTIMCFVFSSLHPPFSRCCSCCPFTFPLVSWPVCQLGTQPLVWHINPSSQALYHQHPLSVASFCKSHHPKAPPLPPASVGTYAQHCWGLHAGTHLWPASEALCYVLGPTQGAFFIFHLLTKPFPSRDQPPIHLDHMTNHLTSHLTTHMTNHMPSQSPAPKSPTHHLILPHLTSHDPIPTPDSLLFAYLSLASGFSARLLYFLCSPVSRLILTPFLLPSRVSQFRSI